ncbi:MFS transporter [bacterium]|nr:MFS transporter [bacterium]
MSAIPRVRMTFARNVYLFLAVQGLVGFTLDGGVFSVLFNIFLLRLGYGPEFVGIVNASGLLAFAILSLPVGLWGKRWGIKRMIVIGLWLMLAGGIFLPLAELLASPWQEAGLIVGYVAIMSGVSAVFVNSTPFFMGSVAGGDRNRVFALQSAVISLAAFVGALLGGRMPLFFADLLGLTTDYAEVYRYPLLVAGLLMLPAIFLMLGTEDVDPRLAERPSSAGGAATPNVAIAAAPFMLLAMLVVVRIFQVSGVATTSTFFNVYLDTELSVATTQIGIISALGRLLAVAGALSVPLLARRFGNLNLVVWSCLGTALCFLPLAFLPHWAAAGSGFIGLVGLSALRYPAFIVYAMEKVSPEQRGLVAGSGEMASGLIFAVIALGGGYWITAFGFQTLFLLASVLSVIGALLFWAYFRERTAPQQAVAAPAE